MFFIFQSVIIQILLCAGMLLYFRIADRYNIIDKPNERSSHNYVTIRGGGIVFWMAGLIYVLLHFENGLFFFIGLTLISTVSLWDDITSLPNKIRLTVHFLAITCVFYALGIFSDLPWYWILVAYTFFAGILNAYNFMDGINGITGLYSMVILLSLLAINLEWTSFTDMELIVYAILSCVVFLFFNFRKRAKCFAGDIGSMAIAFWILTLLLQLMLKDRSLIWILFLAVYGVDAVGTILHRLYLKQNIFKAHRLHFYQILSNECGISHRKVASLYAFVQLLICSIVIYAHFYLRPYEGWIGAGVVILLIRLYLLKFKCIEKYSNR
ncbi:MAG: glycosyltransferase family 4 protein [Dysgonamonadaceae bacterium]|jgi:UDP-N-acetylmuramyl pentapeptide phosphotransferase/UDP-N-acetylglucosamine-1-phosphate transferase|nr:glycosyltransferase family 4 protein [Dysgonamonadaceae bacterium]